MLRRRENRGDIAQLDNLRAPHHRDAVTELGIDTQVVDVDIHEIPAREGEPSHLHLDTRFLVHAPRGATAMKNDESIELRWFAPEDLSEIETDETLLRLFRIAWPEAGS